MAVIGLTTFILASSCTFPMPFRSRSVEVLTYNVQNLFDDTADGAEYEEYDPNRSDWGVAEYYQRLENLSRVIRDASPGGPDVVALQEIEHAGVLEDLRDRFLGGLGYRYVCAAEKSASPIVVGVLSRIPLLNAKTHGAYVDGEVSLRPMLEVELEMRDASLVIFICHWKSKLGGARETEPYRVAAAAALSEVIGERVRDSPETGVIVLGDLNERENEYDLTGRQYQTALMPFDELDRGDGGVGGDQASLRIVSESDVADVVLASSTDLIFFSPWMESGYPGSYSYHGEWERIDHMLFYTSLFDSKGFEFRRFTVAAPEYILDSEGRPLDYSIRGGTGYSDHLPLLVELELQR